MSIHLYVNVDLYAVEKLEQYTPSFVDNYTHTQYKTYMCYS